MSAPRLLALLFVALLAVHPTTATPQEPGRYMVDLREGPLASLDEPALSALIAPVGATVDYVQEELGFAMVRTPSRAALESLLDTRVVPDVIGHGAYVPADPDWSNQWDMTQIGMPAAWDIERGDTEIVVAIVDSGIDPTHPDLQGIPMIFGTDFVGNDLTPLDEQGHGTHIAGTIAATHDAVGMAGMAEVTLLIVRVLDKNNAGSCFDFAAGTVEAATKGARVINLSLWCPSSWVLRAANVYAHGAGSILVGSAGNFQGNHLRSRCVTAPAVYPEVIAVAAVDNTKTVASFSCQGAAVEIAAPGVGVYSTLPGDSYGWWSGTSMAAPHVTAAAALILAIDPSLTNEQVRAILTQATEDLGDPGRDFAYGNGLLRVDLALAAV